MEGDRVGSYVITGLLGQGGMGAVYLAEHELLHRPAALKMLLPALSADQELVDRFFDEARATTSIADPGIVQIFDFGYHTDGSAYLVMEYLEGETLDVRVAGGGWLAPVRALRITRQIATSLEAAHARGVIHRDLKLENVFLVHDAAVPGGERAKILDFGIAKLQRTDGTRGRSRTRTGQIMGTPLYMSPEQCKDAHEIDGRSDIYALGCMLFCMVTGRPPFDFESAGEIIAAHLKDPAPTPASVKDDLPAEWAGHLDAIVARCLAKDPADRYQSMAELAKAIATVLGDGDGRTSSPRISVEPRADTAPVAINALGSAPTLSSSLARPTTLSSAVGETIPPVPVHTLDEVPHPRRRRRLGPVLALAVVTVLAGVVLLSTRAGVVRGGPRPASATEAVEVAPAPAPPAPVLPPTVIAVPSIVAVPVPMPPPAPVVESIAPPAPVTKASAKQPAAKKPAAKQPLRRTKPAPKDHHDSATDVGDHETAGEVNRGD